MWNICYFKGKFFLCLYNSLATAVLKLSVSTSMYLVTGTSSNAGASCSNFVSEIAFKNAEMWSSSPLWKIAPEKYLISILKQTKFSAIILMLDTLKLAN